MARRKPTATRQPPSRSSRSPRPSGSTSSSARSRARDGRLTGPPRLGDARGDHRGHTYRGHRHLPWPREFHWHTVERYVRAVLGRVADAVGTYAFRAIPGETPSYAVPDGDHMVQIDTPVRHVYVKSDYRHPFLGDLVREEWRSVSWGKETQTLPRSKT
jgi:hypothetical protein